MDDDQIKHMVNRFLTWRLPANFGPDNGIGFEPTGNKGTPHEYERRPLGTTLFDATQADIMVRHMIDGLPPAADSQAGEVDLRETIARIIDPSSWRVMDSYLADAIRECKGRNASYDPAAFKDKKSLAKANEILAAISALRRPSRGDGGG